MECVLQNARFLFSQKHSLPIVILLQRHLVQYNIHGDYLMIMKAFADPEQFLRNRATHVDNPIVHLFFSEGTGFEAFLEISSLFCCDCCITQTEADLDLADLLDANEMSVKDLQDSIANLIAVILGTPPFSNHLCLHLLMPEELSGTYAPGSLVCCIEWSVYATRHPG